MIRAGVLTLIAETPSAHGVFEEYTPTQRTVYCNIRSVSRNETYTAMSLGLKPEYVFELSDYAEYNGEKLCLYNGEQYNIIRTYVAGQKIELTVAKEV